MQLEIYRGFLKTIWTFRKRFLGVFSSRGTVPALIILGGLLLNAVFTLTPTTTQAVLGGPEQKIQVFTTQEAAMLASSDNALPVEDELGEEPSLPGQGGVVSLEFASPFGPTPEAASRDSQPGSTIAAVSGPGGVSRSSYLPKDLKNPQDTGKNCIWPMKGLFYGGAHGSHNAQDIDAPVGTPVVASCDGIVKLTQSSGYNGGFGKNIVIVHDDGSFTTRYAHLSSVDVVEGQRVTRGEKIGESGNTGKSTGPHLHFELWTTK